MKSLQTHLTEALNESLDLKKSWDDKLIPFDKMIEFAKQALEKSKTKPGSICSEIGNYKDPDDLWNAFDRGELKSVSDWQDEFTNLIADTDEWGGKEGDIADKAWDILYDIMDQISRKKL